MLNLKPRWNVQLIAEGGKHFYSVDNQLERLPGVTGVLDLLGKPALIPWASKVVAEYILKRMIPFNGLAFKDRFYGTLLKRAKKQPRFIKESTARAGSRWHKMFDDDIQGRPIESEDIPWKSYKLWRSKLSWEIVAGDIKIASLRHRYGGSLDCILKGPDGKLYIGDFKTGNRIYESHAYQVAAYAYAFQEQYALDYTPGAFIVRFDKAKVRYEQKEINDIGDSFRGFKAALDLANVQKFPHFCNEETVKEEKIKEKSK